MGKAGKRKEMVEDRCVQEMHVEGRCVKEFRVKVLLVKEVVWCVCVCAKAWCVEVVCWEESCVRVLWVKERYGTGVDVYKSVACTSIAWARVCQRIACERVVWDRFVCVKVWCKNVLCIKCCMYKCCGQVFKYNGFLQMCTGMEDVLEGHVCWTCLICLLKLPLILIAAPETLVAPADQRVMSHCIV